MHGIRQQGWWLKHKAETSHLLANSKPREQSRNGVKLWNLKSCPHDILLPTILYLLNLLKQYHWEPHIQISEPMGDVLIQTTTTNLLRIKVKELKCPVRMLTTPTWVHVEQLFETLREKRFRSCYHLMMKKRLKFGVNSYQFYWWLDNFQMR